MPDQPHNGNGHRTEKQEQPPARVSPIVPGRPGRPSFSLAALRERIERQFQEETAHRTDILLELDTEEKRREMLAEVADYVLAVEAVTLAERDKRTLIDAAYRNLFTFGPLDAYLQDDTVTAITINGPYAISVQHGMGKLEAVAETFDDPVQLAGVLERVLATGGAVLPENDPFLEVGVTLAGRAARLSLVAPPVSPHHSLDMRLHPRQPVTLTDLDTRWQMVPPPAAELLIAILRAGYGLLIVGDVALGKTTLAGALARSLPDDVMVRAAERAAELALPPNAIRHVVKAAGPTDEHENSTFADEFLAALAAAP
ncbi:MAG: Flp pilus assembly complex ATPase component TadA, partial [Anaerolineae bacterium]|nr:Flp pilus assembly complex ATPase component TadA [Anaerolineae bacterium]